MVQSSCQVKSRCPSSHVSNLAVLIKSFLVIEVIEVIEVMSSYMRLDGRSYVCCLVVRVVRPSDRPNVALFVLLGPESVLQLTSDEEVLFRQVGRVHACRVFGVWRAMRSIGRGPVGSHRRSRRRWSLK